MSPGFTMIDNDTVMARLPAIDGTAFKVYGVLALHADAARTCWPSLATIGRETGLKPRAVRSALRRLESLGLVLAEHHTGRTALYHLTPAPSCRPDNGGPAPECRPPRHDDAAHPGTAMPGTPAPPCRLTRTKNNTQEQDPGNKTQRGKAAAAVEIPQELDSAEFVAAWDDWLQHRRETKKPATATAQRKTLSMLSEMGTARAIAAINHSIANGWQGIFEPPRNGDQRNGRARHVIGPGQRHPADRRDQEGSF